MTVRRRTTSFGKALGRVVLGVGLALGSHTAVAEAPTAASAQAAEPTTQNKSGNFVGFAEDEKPAYPGAVEDGIRGVGVEEKLGNALPLDTVFTDERGRSVRLGDYFDGERPVILQLGYYACPMLCGLVSEGMALAVGELEARPAEDYRIVSISIDPNETANLAQLKKQSFLREINKPGLSRGWAFLTGNQEAIDAVAGATGFAYRWVPLEREFSHPSVIMILTPDGKVSRYLYGMRYPTADLTAALDAARGGETMQSANPGWIGACLQAVGSAMGRYSGSATLLMQLAAVLTVLGLGSTVFVLFFRYDKRHKTAVGENSNS